MSNNIDQLADELYERIDNRLREREKRNRSEKGTGDVRIGSILRKYRGPWSIRAVAEDSGLHYSFIGRIERGERGMSLESFAALADVFGPDYAVDTIRMVNHVNRPDQYPDPNRSKEPASEQAVPEQPRASAGGAGSNGRVEPQGNQSTPATQLAPYPDYSVRRPVIGDVPDQQF